MTALTVWTSGPVTELAAKDASPLYATLMVCVPSARDAVESVAWSLPLTTWSRTGDCETPSIVNVTVPVGVPVAAPVTDGRERHQLAHRRRIERGNERCGRGL